MKSKSKSRKCATPLHIRQAGHNLKVRHSSKAGTILATLGKRDKIRRVNAGCVDGLAGVVKLKTTRTKNATKTLYAVPVSEFKKIQGCSMKTTRKGRRLAGTTGGTFSLSAKQKRNLPPQLQKAIINHHRKQGKRIVN
ncbi:MAG TPA: hypothetical protein VD905_19705 [Flavobacteriales bacterium]|nr:hypothetical protein [Flavobacteriales bacterium]